MGSSAEVSLSSIEAHYILWIYATLITLFKCDLKKAETWLIRASPPSQSRTHIGGTRRKSISLSWSANSYTVILELTDYK